MPGATFLPVFLFDIEAYDRLWFCLLTRKLEIMIGQKKWPARGGFPLASCLDHASTRQLLG
jgi:hypothetical protein